MHAVCTSHLAKPLRDVALALGWFANEQGADIWPAIETLSKMVGSDVRSVRRGLRELRDLGVIHAENLSGGRGLTTRYRFDFTALALLEPGHRRPGLRVRKPGHHPPPLREAAKKTRTPAAENPDTRDRKPGHMTLKTRVSAPSDLNEPSGTVIEPTGKTYADAYASPDGEEAEKESNGPPFKVYAAIASQCIERAVEEEKSFDEGSVSERFKAICARQSLPYDSDLTARAVRAALGARRKRFADYKQQRDAHYRG